MNLKGLITETSLSTEAMEKFLELAEAFGEEFKEAIDADLYTFSENTKKLLFDTEKLILECPKLHLTKHTEVRDSYKQTAGEVRPEVIFYDLIHKLDNAPTTLHMHACVKVLIPIIADRIREEEKKSQ